MSKTLAFKSPLLAASAQACDAEELFEFKVLQERTPLKPATVGPSSSTAAPLEDAYNLEADPENIITEEEEELHKAAMLSIAWRGRAG